jgi:peroxidase
MGPLFTHIITDQFTRTRAADDTFGDLDPALGDDIIAEVKASSFATIISRNTDVDMVQDDVFLAADRSLTEIEAIETSWRADVIDLAAKSLNGSLYTGSGDDILTLSGGTVISGNVHMELGNDTLIASSGVITGSVDMGLGDDTVTLTGTADVLADVSTYNGDATVTLADMAHVGGSVLTGHGDDAVVLTGRATIDGDLRTGHGQDDIFLGARTTVSGEVDAGKGDDIIRLQAGASVKNINGGKGLDTLTRSENTRIEYDEDPTNGTVFYLDDAGNDTGESVDFRLFSALLSYSRISNRT